MIINKLYAIFSIFCFYSLGLYAQKQPNIIFILTDDQRWDALGNTGNKLAHTPEMDKLAQSGTYFRKAMVTTPICAASRATILSGMYERAHRYTFQTGAIKDEFMANAYPKILRGAGYYTGFFGKLGVRYDQKKELFDVHEEYDRNGTYTDTRGYFFKKIGKDTVHLTRYTGQKAIDFIENAPTDKPFCLSLSFSAPHAHDNAPDQYFWDKETDYWLKDVTIPPADLGEDKYFNAQPEKVKTGFNHVRWTWRFDNPEKYQRMVKGYYRMIAGIDLEIAKIRAELQKKGLDKNTIIIVMGDNGYFLGERQLADKWLMYDQSVRVPLIIYDPRTALHQETDEMALNVDISATMADLAGVPQPKNWHGKSLLPLVSGANKTLNRDTVLIEHLWETKDIPPSEGVRMADFKYFRYVNDKSWEELYDLKNDPKEINNLAKTAKYNAVLNSLRLKTNNLSTQFDDAHLGILSGLKVEFNKDNTPAYSWIVPKEAVAQVGYQILVASSKADIDNNIGDVWNSQQVKNKSSANILHKGKPLQKGKDYYWKVRIWDSVSRTSNYSEMRVFKN